MMLVSMKTNINLTMGFTLEEREWVINHLKFEENILGKFLQRFTNLQYKNHSYIFKSIKPLLFELSLHHYGVL